MKKMIALILLAGTGSMLQADYYSGGGCSAQPGYYQDGRMDQQYPGYQGQQYQGQYPGYQGQPMQGQYRQEYRQGPQGQQMQGARQEYNPGYQGQQNQGQFRQEYRQDGQYEGRGNMVNMDQKMTTDIQDSIRSAFSDKYNRVQVRVNNGNVTLDGTVPSMDDRTSLEQKVRKIEGVRGVVNNVQVQNR